MASRSLTDLIAPCYQAAARAMRSWEDAGLTVIITCTLRTAAEQGALYAQGREPLTAVNKLRSDLGLYLLNAKENKIVTNAGPGESIHQYGLAFDVVPLIAGKPCWDKRSAVWTAVGALGEAAGLEWAGRWKTFPEYPHFQATGGLTIADLREGKRPALA